MTTRSRILFLFLGTLLGSPVTAQVTRRASVSGAGAEANLPCWYPSISADGRYVAFHSQASNLVPGDTNGYYDVFVRDLVSGTTEVVSVDSSGALGNGWSQFPQISGDGRYVVYQSDATNLIPNDVNQAEDIFVHDRVAHTTELVNLTSSGGTVQLGWDSFLPSISPDGRYVTFLTGAGNVVPGDTNGWDDVFVRDRLAGTTERVSVATTGEEANSNCEEAAPISADGRFVCFTTTASNLVPGDSVYRDVFVHDRLTHATEKVTVATDGTAADEGSWQGGISLDGRFVAFSSRADNLAANDTNNIDDAFLRDRVLGTTQRVSLNSGEGQGGWEAWPTSVSADGRFVTIHSQSENFVPGDTNVDRDLFVRDVVNGTTERASLDSEGAQANGHTDRAAITPDGRWIVFTSFASNLIPGDTNGYIDVFVRDREATSFSIVCDPGALPVIACPCSNPPAGPSRGCDNSAGTGGAALRASGAAHLSADTLVFTTSGQKPTALSIVLQGTVFLNTGTTYGQGVRCVGGSLKRLYAKNAVAGSITAPDFGAGDPSVSARSAAKGDTIQPGQLRWYLVYYRDNAVLGGCPASSTFNATQAGQVAWSP